MLLSERKRNLLSAVASANTSRTNGLKQLVQLNPIFSAVLFIIELKTLHLIKNCKQKQQSRGVLEKRKGVPKICRKFTGEQPCRRAISIKLWSIWTAASVQGMSNIAFIPLLFTQVPFSRLPKSYRRLKISFYFHTVYAGVFSS